jgi:glycosyltransferase involved in cell wall biosynthesis
MAGQKKKLAHVVSHPIQYFTPLYQHIAENATFDFKVFYLSNYSLKEFTDPGFGKSVKWDIDLIEGYDCEFLPSLDPIDKPSANRPVFTNLKPVFQDSNLYGVWTHGYSSPTMLRTLLRARRKGLITMVRSDNQLKSMRITGGLRKAKSAFIQNFLFPRIDAFLAVGKRNAEYYMAHGAPQEKVYGVPYAVDNAFFQSKIDQAREKGEEIRTELGIESSTPVIIFVGKFIARKRPQDLIEAWARIAKNPGKIQKPALVMVGDGPLLQDAKRQAEEKRLSGVHFVGFKNVTEIPAYYALADVFSIPSEAEPWGLVVNEALNAGLPIVATDEVGAAPDLVRENENGFIVPVGDIDATEQALRRILSDPETTRKMSERSLQLTEEYSFAADLEGLEAVMAGTPPSSLR